MKVLFVDTSPIRRGAQVFVQELASFIGENKGIVCKRVYLYRPETGAEKVYLGDQDICLKGNSRHFFEKIPTIHPKLLKMLIGEIKAFSPDVVVLNGSRTLKYGALAKVFVSPHIKFVNRIIDNAEFWNTSKITYWYYRLMVIPQMDACIAVSRASLQAYESLYGYEKPSRVIHRVFDGKKFTSVPHKIEARKALGLSIEDEIVIFVGNITRQKRLDRFLEVITLLKEKRPHLKALILGDGPDLPKYSKQIKALPWIKFFGYQSDVGPFLSASDLLLLTSDTEGLPGVVLEAAYFKVTSVAARVGGIEECIIDGKSGFLVDKEDVKAYVMVSDRLLGNPELRLKLGDEAKILVDQNFTMENAAGSFIEFLKEVVGK